MKNTKLIITLLLFFAFNSVLSAQSKPLNLTVSEGFTNPIGLYDNQPSFSWKLPENTISQSAYAIVMASSPDLLPDKADIWSSGKTSSAQSTFVKYNGPKLSSRQQVYWQVKFWDNKSKSSQWSDKASIELGLLSNNDWKAKWICIPESKLTEIDSKGSILFRPQYFRKEIDVKSDIKKARLYITSKGVYEAFINGNKVGPDIMPPGWTPYSKFISTLTYDVTSMLQKGENTLGFVVAEGWYAGRINLRSIKKTIQHTPKLLCQLEIEYADGKQIIVSDNSFKVTTDGPIRISTIYDGETFDANYNLGGWTENEYDDSKWLKAVQAEVDNSIALLPKQHLGVKDKEVLDVKTVKKVSPQKAIFDFGQNNVGVPLVKVPMKKGDTLKIRFSEMLDLDGSIYTTNYRSALSTNYYIASKDGYINWRPTFTFHGYRYIELSGYDAGVEPQNDWLSAIVQYSDFETNGTFTSSHAKLNQLQSNIQWGLKSNFFDVPTDCPQRDERLGWTGDAQVIAPTSIFNASMYAFWNDWMKSVRADQRKDGGVPNVVPDNLFNPSSSGWGDVCVIVPWEIYYRTGDKKILEENFDMMLKWIDFYKSKAKKNIVKMTSFCDWLQPFTQAMDNSLPSRRGDTPSDYINTAYFARSVELTMQIAQVLGKNSDYVVLKKLHHEIKDAFQPAFFDNKGKLKFKEETQTGYLLALYFGLIDKKLESKVVNNLKQLIASHDNHLRTGFLGTPILPFVLDKIGSTDLMYSILFKETYPSWFYSINQGATTMWERWDSYTLESGFNKGGMNSFNHYAYGAIGQWMYERIAGIKPITAGYKEIEIAPLPGGPLTSAKASYDTPYGKVSSAWKITDGKFILEVTVPSNTTAKIIVPGNTKLDITINGNEKDKNIKQLNKTDKNFEFSAVAGKYIFESNL